MCDNWWIYKMHGATIKIKWEKLGTACSTQQYSPLWVDWRKEWQTYPRQPVFWQDWQLAESRLPFCHSPCSLLHVFCSPVRTVLMRVWNRLRGGEYPVVTKSRVDSTPSRLTKTRQKLFGLNIMAGAGMCTHQSSPVQSSRVQSSPVQSSPVQSSPVQSSPVYAHGSRRNTSLNVACFIFAIRVPVVGRDCR